MAEWTMSLIAKPVAYSGEEYHVSLQMYEKVDCINCMHIIHIGIGGAGGGGGPLAPPTFVKGGPGPPNIYQELQ